MKLNPENLLHHSKHEEGVFTFLLTGDALYSLHEPETARIWEIILSLPSVRIICDRQELALRGISIEGLKMKNPDQVIDHNRLGVSGQQSFWNDVAKIARQHEQPIPSTIGYLQHRIPVHAPLIALCRPMPDSDSRSPCVGRLYAYLDGIHLGHTGQNPTESENIGRGLEEIAKRRQNGGCSAR